MTTTTAAGPNIAGAPQLLKGIGKIDGDGFKDTTRKGEVVFVYAQPLAEPYAPGQYPRVGNTGYSASTEQFDFTPATIDEAREHIEARLAAAADDLARAKKLTNDLGKIIHDMTVAQQAAWIEWRHGKGAEEAMTWIHNGLAGPGFIPDEDEPYGKEAQAWYDARLTLKNAPLGTLAPAIGGGAWCKVGSGWKWNGPGGTGGTFPRPGGDWDGKLIDPTEKNGGKT